jgi:DNA-binding response OmpR family regulator
MTQDKVRRLDRLTGQLVEALMTAALVAEEIRGEVRSEIDEDDVAERPACNAGGKRCRSRPLLSESTLSVSWKGRSLYLGHTLAFRLLERLARRPNQYVTHLDLLRDVWDDEELETATIRSVVRHLRRRLRDGGMTKLANSIEGHNGRYVLKLG